MSDLAIYLNDHLAGATAGLSLARRILSQNRDTPLGDFFDELVLELERDRDELLAVMKSLRVPRSWWKPAVGNLAERLGRLKLNGRLLGYSDMSRLFELETLALGVDNKRNLWRTLREVLPAAPALRSWLDELCDRADDQRQALESHRVDAARRALGDEVVQLPEMSAGGAI